MRNEAPKCADTEVVNSYTWKPKSADSLFEEVEHIAALAKRIGNEAPTLLYRGQENDTWELNSTYARWFQDNHDVETAESYHVGSAGFLTQYGKICTPSEEVFKECEKNDGLDPWFELMKRIQQHKEEFEGLKPCATNLLDWSCSLEVGLCFGSQDEGRTGALYILDLQEAGKILHRAPYREVLDAWAKNLEATPVTTFPPLLFCPAQQLGYSRAEKQQARYIAQFDFRMPLEQYWQETEQDAGDTRIYRKILLEPGVKSEVLRRLARQGLTTTFLLE